MIDPKAGATWSSLNTGLPNALVSELHYNYNDKVLIAATMGRGAWILPNAVAGALATAMPAVAASPEDLIPLAVPEDLHRMPPTAAH